MTDRHLLSIDDLAPGESDELLARAQELALGAAPKGPGPLVGLLFFAPSLRTRVGFAAAAARLGGSSIHVSEARFGAEMSAAESFEDGLRTLRGMVDLVVTRTPVPLDRRQLAGRGAAVVNGGEGGGEHPTQALIDLLAIREERGPLADLAIGVVGDLGARSLRSLLKLLEQDPPGSLHLAGPPGQDDPGEIGPRLRAVSTVSNGWTAAGLDVLLLPGLPPGPGADAAATLSERMRFAFDADRAEELPADAVVLSPMPVIDEIAPEVRDDPRIRMFEQSDRGVAVRMAVLERSAAG